jgi:hypothetical protein
VIPITLAATHIRHWPGFVSAHLNNNLNMALPTEPTAQSWPVTVRRSIELLGIFLLGYLVYVGNGVLAPLLMAFFISILLLQV